MSTGVETVDLVEPFLWTTLSGDAALVALVGGAAAPRVHGTTPPASPVTPYVLWVVSSSRDVRNHAGQVVWVDCLAEVKAVGQGQTWSQVRPIARRIDALLRQRDGVAVPGGTITSRRERIVQYPEIADNVPYRHLGAVYRLQAHST